MPYSVLIPRPSKSLSGACTPGLLWASLLLALIGCERPAAVTVENERPVMGTLAKVTAVAPNRDTAVRAIEAAYGRLDDVNRLMSDYVPNSEVGRLNALEAGSGLAVSPETYHCIERAAEISAASGGAFDVTCRPLVQLWKQAGKLNELPTEQALADVMTRVGWRKLSLDPQSRTVTPQVARMQIDLGGIAKGYSLDLAAEALLKAGATSGLVDVGGDVRAVGPRKDGKPWRVGVRHPFQPGLFCKLDVRDRAVATSGVQERFADIGGKRYSHIVDPRTGWPAERAPAVTVIAPDGLTADAWATVFSVLSVDEGKALLAAGSLPGVEVLWLLRSNGQVQVHQTPGFEQYVVKQAD